MRVEKRVAGIIKWLERLKKSYSSGAMESALMDAECARADLEDLRLDVWAKVSPSANRNSAVLSRMLNCTRTISLAVIIVMASVVPLSREVKAPAIEPLKNARAYAGPIVVFRDYERPSGSTSPRDYGTPASSTSASNHYRSSGSTSVREDTAPAHTTKSAPQNADSSLSASSSPRKQTPQKRTAQKRTQIPARTDTRPKTAATVPYDKVYSLIQTGQRALKNNTSVIKIQ